MLNKNNLTLFFQCFIIIIIIIIITIISIIINNSITFFKHMCELALCSNICHR